MRRAARYLTLLTAWFALSGTASAYYFYVHYLNRGSFQATVEKFDLAALQNKTVPFLISDQQPSLSAGDSFAGLVSQVRLAAKAWSDIESSDLRLAFGGFFSPGTQHSGPVIEVVFGEVPPGLIAATVAELRPELSAGAPGIAAVPTEPFIPIVKSMVVLDRDQSRAPSWSEAFFLTVTHEFGHAIGLQHSFCSGVMSTEVTRATTKAQPLALDDVAGASVLYPARPLSASNGSISGRIAIGNTGINLASVVALSTDGAAISALTAPDGSYRIDGVPPGSYYVYAHPLPPRVSGEAEAGGVTSPLDAAGQAIPFHDNFEAVLYPNARSLDRASTVLVSAGTSTVGINFSVTRRAGPPGLFGVATFSFPGQVAVRPAHLTAGGPASFAVASGYGLTSRAVPTIIGSGMGSAEARPYAPDPRFVRFDFQLSPGASEGPRHLMLATDTDFYVLPAAIRVMRRPPPSLSSASTSADATGARIVNISGQNLGPETQILFDGAPGTIRQADESQITVIPPTAPTGHRAAVVALNRDGQSSLFLQNPAQSYEYESNGDWSFSVAPNQIPVGVETLVEVLGTNANFNAAQTALTFGSATVHVRRLWVAGPNRLLANVLVPAGTQPGTMTVTAGTGLRVLAQQNGFSVTPANPRGISLRSPVTDAGAGSVASVRLIGDVTAASLQVTVNDRPGTVLGLSGGVLSFRVPAGLTAGPGVVRVTSGTESATIGMAIDAAPPAISAAAAAGARVDETRPARPGEVLTLAVTGLADPSAEVTPNRVAVLVNGAPQAILGVATVPGTGHNVQFQLDARTAVGNHPVIVTIDGRASAEFILPVRVN